MATNTSAILNRRGGSAWKSKTAGLKPCRFAPPNNDHARLLRPERRKPRRFVKMAAGSATAAQPLPFSSPAIGRRNAEKSLREYLIPVGVEVTKLQIENILETPSTSASYGATSTSLLQPKFRC